MRMPPGTEIERALAARLGGPVAGVDEAGRGPWAGPVVAAAVVVPSAWALAGLDDSKRVSPAKRHALFARIVAETRHGIGAASVAEIEALGLGPAADLAMRRAVLRVARSGALAGCLVDGLRVPAALGCAGEALVGGDGRSASVAAASVLAKVTRDRIMDRLGARHPGYGWERNRGYGTPEHRAALERLGVSAHHRRGFRPIAEILHKDILVSTCSKMD